MNEDVIVCGRVADIKNPAVPSTYERCSRCGEGVWRSVRANPEWIIVCGQCATQVIAENPNAEIAAVPEAYRFFTKEQTEALVERAKQALRKDPTDE